LGFVDYHKQLAAPLAATFAAILAAAIAIAPLAGVTIESALLRLVVGGATGAAAYIAASYVLNREWLISALELALPGRAWIKA
jgi:hypothetical protein